MPQPRRIMSDVNPQQKQRHREQRRQIAEELEDLCERDRRRQEAKNEPTLSGELRRAIHSSPLPLSEIAAGAGIALRALDEFLTGERTLRSDVLDRLAMRLGLELTAGE
jgi:hypothetical protein